MAFVPNTTPTPNWLYDAMKDMGDTELRVVLTVVRATLGWSEGKGGMRKKEDWITQSQICEKTGRGHSAVSLALQSAISENYIEARTRGGDLLDTPEKRKNNGGKIFYRMGSGDRPLQKVDRGYPESGYQPIQKVDTTKETLTKETLTKVVEPLSQRDFFFEEELEKLRISERRDFKVIALYWKKKAWVFENRKQFISALKRELRPASMLTGYSGEEITRAISHCAKNYPEWTLETIHKRISDLINKK